MELFLILLWQWPDTDINGYSAMSTGIGLLVLIIIGGLIGIVLGKGGFDLSINRFIKKKK